MSDFNFDPDLEIEKMYHSENFERPEDNDPLEEIELRFAVTRYLQSGKNERDMFRVIVEEIEEFNK